MPHIFGHIGSIQKIKYIADKYNITLVEDAVKHLEVGLAKFMLVFTACAVSLASMGQNSYNRRRRLRHNKRRRSSDTLGTSRTAKISHPYEYFHNELGFNYRMPNINAALGVNQIKRPPEMLRQKQRLTRLYDTAFANVDKLDFYRHDNGSYQTIGFKL